MIEVQSLLLFVLASLSINLIPGPDVIYIVSSTMRGKASAGLRAALGLGVGYFIHTFAAVVGLSALILNSALAFTLVKYLGAAYLLYLGISALKNMVKGETQLNVKQAENNDNGIFKQGIIVSIFNPKVALFFLSFLPQFINLEAGNGTSQLLILGVVFSILATCCNLLYALLGSWLVGRASRFNRILEGVSGVLLIGLAGKVAFSRS